MVLYALSEDGGKLLDKWVDDNQDLQETATSKEAPNVEVKIIAEILMLNCANICCINTSEDRLRNIIVTYGKNTVSKDPRLREFGMANIENITSTTVIAVLMRLHDGDRCFWQKHDQAKYVDKIGPPELTNASMAYSEETPNLVNPSGWHRTT
ncbi:MAG: hypothetical protein AAGA53_16060 [Pseudomonadota bacterium]